MRITPQLSTIASPFPPVWLSQNQAVRLGVPAASAPRERQRHANLTAPRRGRVARNRVHPEIVSRKEPTDYTILKCRQIGCESDRCRCAGTALRSEASSGATPRRPPRKPNDTKQVL